MSIYISTRWTSTVVAPAMHSRFVQVQWNNVSANVSWVDVYTGTCNCWVLVVLYKYKSMCQSIKIYLLSGHLYLLHRLCTPGLLLHRLCAPGLFKYNNGTMCQSLSLYIYHLYICWVDVYYSYLLHQLLCTASTMGQCVSLPGDTWSIISFNRKAPSY